MKSNIRKLVMAAMIAALTCVITYFPMPIPMTYGYVNLGDCIVLLGGWLLPPVYGFAAAAVGSAMADIFATFAVYAPATFVIKGLMALCAHCLFKLLAKKTGGFVARAASGIVCEIIMVGGYFAFESILYGIGGAAASVYGNVIQGTVCLVIAVILIKIFEKYKITLK